MSIRAMYKNIIQLRQQIFDIETQREIWLRRGAAEMRGYIRAHQKRLKDIKEGAIPLHGELEDLHYAIIWCQARLKDPAIRIKELDADVAVAQTCLQMNKDVIHELERRTLQKWNEISKALMDAEKVRTWMREQYPGIAGARE